MKERELHRFRRTIPTRVGRTHGKPLVLSTPADHPHAGGENVSRNLLTPAQNGPSPRGWGERHKQTKTERFKRTIPTRVGRTTLSQWYHKLITDHPHAGGENALMFPSSISDAGPSPRGWGELGGVIAGLEVARTIPTRVGRTLTRCMRCTPRTDHPHAGGENSPRPAASPATGGPSPRGWGERPTSPTWSCWGRTIPTRVGRTIRPSLTPCMYTDHPHAGGENSRVRQARARESGPSPRGWGELWISLGFRLG